MAKLVGEVKCFDVKVGWCCHLVLKIITNIEMRYFCFENADTFGVHVYYVLLNTIITKYVAVTCARVANTCTCCNISPHSNRRYQKSLSVNQNIYDVLDCYVLDHCLRRSTELSQLMLCILTSLRDFLLESRPAS